MKILRKPVKKFSRPGGEEKNPSIKIDIARWAAFRTNRTAVSPKSKRLAGTARSGAAVAKHWFQGNPRHHGANRHGAENNQSLC